MLEIFQSKNFLNLKPKFSNPKSSKVVVIPFGLEQSVSYGRGTKNGPRAILEASTKIELFDEELKEEICQKAGIATLKAIRPTKNRKRALEQLYQATKAVMAKGKLPIILGGEHTLTIGSFKAVLEQYPDLTLLQFDAHADLRDSLEGDKYSHGAAMRRCLDLSPNFNLVQVGVRSISNEPSDGKEFDFWEARQKRIMTFWAKDMKHWKINDIVTACRKNVYLSFDVDVFDPAIMPATGTPEPGGLTWGKVLDILRAVMAKKNIVGADFVELAPLKNLNAPNFTVAKLIYKFIGYKFFKVQP